MAGFLRFLLGIVMIPVAWGVTRAVLAMIGIFSQTSNLSLNALSFFAGVIAFAVAWIFASAPVKTYVLAHELTHALWGMLFGAKASKLKVSENGGSVNLTKTNFLIILAPYFFPFYSFVVIIATLITSIFVKPLPWLPAWIFGIGFTWSFHVLFTIDTLTRRQSDVTMYGRVFSWVFIYIANLMLVLVCGAAASDNINAGDVFSKTLEYTLGAYLWVFGAIKILFNGVMSNVS